MSEQCRINERGNAVIGWWVGGERYRFDFRKCPPAKGWAQYDTDQDASYFGVWVNIRQREIVTFAEGDFTRVLCPTVDHLRAELDSMAECYGDPPPAAITYAMDGTRTEFYDTRPSVDGAPERRAIARALDDALEGSES